MTRTLPIKTDVTNRDVVDVAVEAARAGRRPLVLVHASGVTPGGGWRVGASGQEERLVSATGGRLARALACGWTNTRDQDELTLALDLDLHGYPVDFVAMAAPDLRAAPGLDVGVDVRAAVDLLFAVALAHGFRDLILGAWGCGVYRNDPAVVATAFRDALRGMPSAALDVVVFAITDTTPVGLDAYETFRAVLR